jgi:uncharacterized protein (TIGR00730 family)
MKRICVYCGSNPGRNPDFLRAAEALGQALVGRGLGLVYGGASIGVMGAVANAVLAHGGEAIGVIPEALHEKEITHTGLSEQYIVATMHERKALMAELSDGFIALPGGWGTFEEIFEALTWAQLGIHRKPCGLLNVSGYYDHLGAFLEHAIEQQFVKPECRAMLMISQDPQGLLEQFAAYDPPVVKKWITVSET